MNVIIANERHDELSNLDIDIIKNMTGTFDAYELVEMFKNFFFSRMIIDVTALKNNEDIRTYELLASGMEIDKIIFLLPENSKVCSSSFLAKLISIKIYNFTTNINGVMYLLKRPNTLKDVERIIKQENINASNDTGAAVTSTNSNRIRGTYVLGIKSVTSNAGATTLTYLMKRELSLTYGKENVLAIEINKNDFPLFNEKNMISIKSGDMNNILSKYSSVRVILVDLNNTQDTSFCKDIIYLLEPSTIKLNGLVREDRNVFSRLVGCKVVLNKSLLLNNDIYDFEGEAGIKVFYNMPPLDERKRNSIVHDFLNKLGLFDDNQNEDNTSKIFGLFRR